MLSGKSVLRATLLICLFVLPMQVAPGSAFAAYDEPVWTVTRTDGITYGVGGINGGSGTKDLLLDLYEPDGNPDTQKPGIVLIHGGGFTGGSRGGMSTWGNAFAARGYVAVSISYRLLGDNPVADPSYGFFIPNIAPAVHAAAVDAKRAIRWMRANAESLGLDENIIFIGGISAGAFTSLHAGVSPDDVFATDMPGETPRAINNPAETAVVSAILDWCGGAMPEYFDEEDPPVMIVHTTGDSVVPVGLADIVEDQCQENGIPYEYYRLEKSGHCSFFGDTIDGLSMVNLTVRFLNRMFWDVEPPEPAPVMLPLTKLRLKDDPRAPAATSRRRTSFLSRSKVDGQAPLAPAPGSDSDPTLNGGRLELYAAGDSPGDIRVIELPASGWQSVGKDAQRGYVYRERSATTGGRLLVRLRDGMLKIVDKGSALADLSGAPLEQVTLRLHLGSEIQYCIPGEAGRHDDTLRFEAEPYPIPAAECPERPTGSASRAILAGPESLLS